MADKAQEAGDKGQGAWMARKCLRSGRWIGGPEWVPEAELGLRLGQGWREKQPETSGDEPAIEDGGEDE